ncbi:nuclear transport factor 2 family protein [Halorussus litoreus]|uniref:nuclear transport factor 2 family protein n=1 Tax=Halorussus litoreus TaxID=1710536 RepID=UPI000E287C89|nr:nuclear transport factor 2 family protein [Halorussus litoreus]
MSPTETVEDYYRALRTGEPLDPYFVEREDVVKFGVSERLSGYGAVADGLREQTRTTDDWRVDSRRLQVVVRDPVAWFSDDVALSWLDAEGVRRSFDTRWSGVLERGTDESESGSEDDEDDPNWRFVAMHVSAPHQL